MEAIKSRIEEGKNLLILSNDPDYDRITKGMLRAYSEILSHKAEFGDLLEMLEAEAEGND